MTIRIKLKEILQNNGLTQKQLSELTGIHESTLSDLSRGTRSTINKDHLERIMNALEIKEFDKVLEIVEK